MLYFEPTLNFSGAFFLSAVCELRIRFPKMPKKAVVSFPPSPYVHAYYTLEAMQATPPTLIREFIVARGCDVVAAVMSPL